MCMSEILMENAKLHAEIRKLRDISPFYPQILRQLKPDGEYVMSSNIRKEWQGTWYSVLLVQRTRMNETVTEDMCFARFIAEAYNIILFYKINGQFEEVCPIQISESERLFPKR
jgi:hypothetical protein